MAPLHGQSHGGPPLGSCILPHGSAVVGAACDMHSGGLPLFQFLPICSSVFRTAAPRGIPGMGGTGSPPLISRFSFLRKGAARTVGPLLTAILTGCKLVQTCIPPAHVGRGSGTGGPPLISAKQFNPGGLPLSHSVAPCIGSAAPRGHGTINGGPPPGVQPQL